MFSQSLFHYAVPCFQQKRRRVSQSSSSSLSTLLLLLSFQAANDDDPSDRYFQLEELEDQEACTTELFLNRDRTVTVGETNGPVFVSATGTWEQQQPTSSPSDEFSDGTSFKMVLKRTYRAGKEKTAPTAMGEFQFEVERTFLGELTRVGGNHLAVTGTMHHFDEIFGDSEVGFFNLIDTTQERTSS